MANVCVTLAYQYQLFICLLFYIFPFPVPKTTSGNPLLTHEVVGLPRNRNQ